MVPMLYIWRLFVRSEGIRKDGTHSFKDACGHVATQIGFSMGPVADVKVVRREDRLSIRYANRANGLRAGRLLNAAQWSDGNPRPGQRDSAVDCQGIDMPRRRPESGETLGTARVRPLFLRTDQHGHPAKDSGSAALGRWAH